jgi:hypothetical protein
MRGSSGEEKILKNAKDACAAEALEIATYAALERLAGRVGDRRTADLAGSIRADERRMLAGSCGAAEARRRGRGRRGGGRSLHDITKTGAADAAREVKQKVRDGAKRTARRRARSRASRRPRAGRGARSLPRRISRSHGMTR